MRALALIGVLSSSALGADDPREPRQLIAALVKPIPGRRESFPTPPSIPTALQQQMEFEIATDPACLAALRRLISNVPDTERGDPMDLLEERKAIWSLQGSLCHPEERIQARALKALERLKDRRAVPFLLIYAHYMAVYEDGSQDATTHGILQGRIAATFFAITGVEVRLRGQDPDGLKRAINLWTRWHLDQTQ